MNNLSNDHTKDQQLLTNKIKAPNVLSLLEKMMSMVFQGVQAKFTGGGRSINPHLYSHPTLISFPSAAVVQDALQKWIYSGAVNEMPFTADVTGASAMREPTRPERGYSAEIISPGQGWRFASDVNTQ